MRGVILAAGYGTRFLPASKTLPKEMFPLIDRPAIDFIVEEYIASGINEILIITSRRKKPIEDYFDRDPELEASFQGRADRLEKIKPPRARVFFTRQERMGGTGSALLLAKEFTGDQPFVVAYPDDLHFGDVPLAQQLRLRHEETGCSVLATLHDPPDINRYGVLSLAEDGLHVTGIVEKPPVGQEPSREASIGRFLYTPEIFRHLEEGLDSHKDGEYYHTGAVLALAGLGKMVFHRVEGERLDIGEPSGYLQAIITYARRQPELAAVLKEAL
jgi:UTP--glucose-1-phosphate uridylyltransferase